MTTPLDQTDSERFEAWFAEWQRSTWRPLAWQAQEMPAHWNTTGKHRMELAWQAAIASRAAEVPDRAQVLDLIFQNPTERVASLLESGVDGLGDTWHRFEVSDGQERRGVILTVTQLKSTPQDPPIAAKAAEETPQ